MILGMFVAIDALRIIRSYFVFTLNCICVYFLLHTAKVLFLNKITSFTCKFTQPSYSKQSKSDTNAFNPKDFPHFIKKNSCMLRDGVNRHSCIALFLSSYISLYLHAKSLLINDMLCMSLAPVCKLLPPRLYFWYLPPAPLFYISITLYHSGSLPQ